MAKVTAAQVEALRHEVAVLRLREALVASTIYRTAEAWKRDHVWAHQAPYAPALAVLLAQIVAVLDQLWRQDVYPNADTPRALARIEADAVTARAEEGRDYAESL